MLKEVYTHKVDLDFCGELYRDVIREHKKTLIMENYNNGSENESSVCKNIHLSEEDEKSEEDPRENQTHLGKDTLRSTWWMADETKNKKMN